MDGVGRYPALMGPVRLGMIRSQTPALGAHVTARRAHRRGSQGRGRPKCGR